MAISASAIFMVLAGGTSTAGGGFVTGAGSKSTNLTATSATGNAPVVSSVSYTFVANDVGHWLYIQGGGTFYEGFYPISSVAGGNATINATIGAASVKNTVTGQFEPNTVAGCASAATPSSGVWAVNYAMKTSVGFTFTDLVIDGATNTDATSAANPITVAMIGNVLNVTGGDIGFTVQRVELVSIPSGVIGRFDKSLGTLGSTPGEGKMGGALDLPTTMATITSTANAGLDGQTIYFGTGTYSYAGVPNFAKINRVIGFNTVPGDIDPYSGVLTNAPVFRRTDAGAVMTNTTSQKPSYFENFVFDGNSVVGSEGPQVGSAGYGTYMRHCKMTAFDGIPLRVVGVMNIFERCEFTAHDTSIIPYAAGSSTYNRFIGCYFHDWTADCLRDTAYGLALVQGCIFDTITGDGIEFTTNPDHCLISNCAFYNISGYGVNYSSTGDNTYHPHLIQNCIFEACATGAIRSADVTRSTRIFSVGNFFWNNGANHTNVGVINKSTSLSASPFADAAGGDFTLHDTNGIPVMGSGWPSTIPGTTTQVNPTPGASQGKTANRGDATPPGKAGFGSGGYNGNIIGG